MRAARAAWMTGIAVGAGVLSAGLITVGALDGAQRSLSDRLFPIGDHDERVLVVGVDDDALAAAGAPWPWPRDVHARLLRELAKGGAAVVGYDLLLSPPRPDDDVLVDALDAAPEIVLVAVPGAAAHQPGRPVATVSGLAEPSPALLAAGALEAHAGVNRDARDGVSRDLPLVLETPDGRFMPALSAALAAVVDGAPLEPVVRRGAVQVGDRVIPTERAAQLRIAWPSRATLLGPSGFMSAADVLDGVPPGSLEGRVVLVGVAAPSLGDVHLTPVDKGAGMPGVTIHAAALHTILTGSSVREATAASAVGWSTLLAGAGAALTLRRRLRLAAVAVPAALIAYLAYVAARAGGGVLEHLVLPPLALLAATVAALAVRYLTEARDRRRVAGLLSRYVPSAVAARLVAEAAVEDIVGGRRAEVSVFFCDLRGFTPYTATLDPEQVRLALETYYDAVAANLADHGGTLMQFVGDEVFAVFGVPELQPDHRTRAIRCALAVQASAPEINRRLAAAGLPPIAFGIAVHSGQVVAASIGTDSRRQYSVIGDAVNMGSRLCGQAGTGEVVISRDAASGEAASAVPPRAEETGPLSLKGAARDLEGWRVAAP